MTMPIVWLPYLFGIPLFLLASLLFYVAVGKVTVHVGDDDWEELINGHKIALIVRQLERELAQAAREERDRDDFITRIRLRIEEELTAEAARIGYQPPTRAPRPPTAWRRSESPEGTILAPPGSIIYQVLRFVFSSRDVNEVFAPALADMRYEYNQALSHQDPWHARWIHVRGAGALLLAAINVSVLNLLRPAHTIWKVISGR